MKNKIDKIIQLIKDWIIQYKRFLVIKKFLKKANIDFKKDKKLIEIFLNLLIDKNKIENIFITSINISITGAYGKAKEVDLKHVLKNLKTDMFISILFELENKGDLNKFIQVFKQNSKSLNLNKFKVFKIQSFNNSPEILLNVK